MKVLIAYDGSAYADAALDDLRRAGLPREAKALIVCVSDGLMDPSSPITEIGGSLTSRRVTSALGLAREQATRLLVEAKDLAAKAGDRVRSYFPDWEVVDEGIFGTPSRELLLRSEEWMPDLIVVGSQGRSTLGRLLLGSVSKKLATQARSSVRVARPAVAREQDAPPRIMIAVDGSMGAEGAVRAVGRRVWVAGAEVRTVTVDEGVSPARIAGILPTAAEIIRSSNEEAAEKARHMAEWAADELRAIGLHISGATRKGDPQRMLLEEAEKWDADCIFVGSHGLEHPGEKSGLGRVSTALITNAACTVEVVR